MTENILLISSEFFSENFQNDFKQECIFINNNIDYKRFMKHTFDLFLFETKLNKLYYLRGLIIKKNHRTNSGLHVKFRNVYVTFEFDYQKNIEVISTKELANLYSSNAKTFIGNYEKSLMNTISKLGRSYYNPVIDKEKFFYDYHSKLKSVLLYNEEIMTDGNNKVYGFLVREDERFIISLTNEKMINFDLSYLENKNNDYKPYIYEILIDEESNNFHNINHINDEEIYIINFVDKKDNKYNDGVVLNGDLVFSASPFIVRGVQILINSNEKVEKNIKDKIEFLRNQVLKIQKCTESIDDLNNHINFGDINKIYVKIFNTGQSNWIHIDFYYNNGDKSKLIYDLGVEAHTKNLNINNTAEIAANEINGNYIYILSHWDFDHISGVSFLEKEQFETFWIVPELPEKLTFSALRLAGYLIKENNIKSSFIDNSCNNKIIFSDSKLKIGKGKGNGPNNNVSYSKNNNIGIVLSIKLNESILLTGDCEYIQLPDEMINYINSEYHKYLIVSHHGAKIKQKSLKNLLGNFISNNRVGVVCVGENKKYPNVGHKKLLKELGFNIVETRELSYPTPYIINL